MFLNREIEVHEIPVSVDFELDNAATSKGAWGSFELAWGPMKLFQCLACFEVTWIVLQNSTCKTLKQKWKCVLMVLQLAMGYLDSLGMLVGRCLKYLWTKRKIEFGYGLKFAELTLFCKKNGEFVHYEFWEEKGSCFWLVRRYQTCLQCLCKLFFYRYQRWPMICTFSSTWSKRMEVML